MIRFSCHGAAKQVTGSCHPVDTERIHVLVDCSLFQGDREIDEERAADFGFDVTTVNIHRSCAQKMGTDGHRTPAA